MSATKVRASKGLPREVERPQTHQTTRHSASPVSTAETGRPPVLGLVQRRDKTDQDAPSAHSLLKC